MNGPGRRSMNRVADNEPVRRRERRGTVGEDQDAAMKNGWQTKTLADLCEISSALVDPRQPKYQKLLHVGGANIESATGKLIALQTAKDEGLISGKFFFDERAVLYSKIRPYLMKVARPNFKGLCSADIYPLMPRDGLLDRGFLYYLLLTPRFTDFAIAGSARAGMPKVNREHLFAYSLAVPPLPEQRRIVGLLDEAFAGIATAQAHAEKNLQNARALFESHLQAVFTQRGKGWGEKRLEEVCSFSSGGTPSKKNSSYWRGEIPWVSGRDMKSTRLFDSLLHISRTAVDESSTRMAPAGSLLVLVRGMGLAHGAQIGELMVPCAFNQDIRGIHPAPGLIPRYLLFALRHRINSSDGVLSNAAHGTLKIDSDELLRLVIPIPPHKEQQGIVATIDSLQKETQRLAGLYERKLAALAVLKESLLHQAFAGEL